MKNFLTNLNSLNVPFSLNLASGVGFKNNNGASCFSMMPYYNAPFDIPWGTENCAYMFYRCNSFNLPVNIMQETPLTNMYGMFKEAISFEQDINIPYSCTDFGYILDRACFGTGHNYSANVHIYCPSSASYREIGNYCYGFEMMGNFNGNVIFHRPVENLYEFFYACHEFNRPWTVPRGAIDISYMCWRCDNLNSVITIPNTVTEANWVFSDCYNLRVAINLPDSVRNAYDAFEGCSNLNVPIRIPVSSNISGFLSGCRNYNKPTYVPNYLSGNSIFSGCENLNSMITFDDSIENMNSTFSGCYNFNQNITLPSSLKLAINTFSSCRTLNQNIQFPANVESMRVTFNGCWNLNCNIEIPSNVKFISGLFGGCYNLNQNIRIPSNVIDMSSAFSQCRILDKNIAIPDNVQQIERAFFNCMSLNQNIKIPNNCRYINNAFQYCVSLCQDIEVPSSAEFVRSSFYNTGVMNVNLKCARFAGYTYLQSNMSPIDLASSANTFGKTPTSLTISDIEDKIRIEDISWGTPIGTCYFNAYAEVGYYSGNNFVKNTQIGPIDVVQQMPWLKYVDLGDSSFNINSISSLYNSVTNGWNDIQNSHPWTWNNEFNTYEWYNRQYNIGGVFKIDDSRSSMMGGRIVFADYRNARRFNDIRFYWYQIIPVY